MQYSDVSFKSHQISANLMLHTTELQNTSAVMKHEENAITKILKSVTFYVRSLCYILLHQFEEYDSPKIQNRDM